MRTNIVIDDELMNEAMTLSQIKTKKGVVETGLKLLVQIKRQEKIKSLRGKLKWDGDLNADPIRITKQPGPSLRLFHFAKWMDTLSPSKVPKITRSFEKPGLLYEKQLI